MSLESWVPWKQHGLLQPCAQIEIQTFYSGLLRVMDILMLMVSIMMLGVSKIRSTIPNKKFGFPAPAFDHTSMLKQRRQEREGHRNSQAAYQYE